MEQPSASQQKSFNSRLDSVGSIVSFICAIHCFLTPLVVVFLPLAIAGSLGHTTIHSWLVIVSLVLALFSVILGHRRHKKYNIFFLPVVAAVLFYFSSSHSHDWSHALCMGLAGLILVSTHVINRKLCQDCKVCKHEQCL